MAAFDFLACLRWAPVEARDAARDLKLIIDVQEFRGLFADAETGFWRGMDALGNSVTIRVVA